MPAPDRSTTATTLTEANARVEALWEMVDSLAGIVETLQGQNEELREQVAELLERAGKSSRTSSRPPSSDSAAQRAKRPRKARTGRSKGAQKGHEKHERAVLPESEVDQVHRHFPSGTCACGEAVTIDAEPHCRHQVFDLPVVRPVVSEHQLFGGVCGGCGQRHVCQAPNTVPSGQMGPGLVAWIATMNGDYHLPLRAIQRLLAEQWNLSFSLGAVSAARDKATVAMEAAYRQIGETVRGEAVAHADETRHPNGGLREHTIQGWLWALVCTQASWFRIGFSRGMGAASELLGEFGGILVTDDYSGYNRVAKERRQLCWAHLLRHFAAMGERVGNGGSIGRRLLLIGRLVVRTRHRRESGQINECEHRRRQGRLRRWLREELERGSRLRSDGRTKRQCVHLLGREVMLWTFVEDGRVPLTNNLAERALRPHVIWRKRSFATHSRRGVMFHERVLSVATTARQQGVPFYAYLRRICAESLRPEGVTTLLPLTPTPPRLNHTNG